MDTLGATEDFVHTVARARLSRFGEMTEPRYPGHATHSIVCDLVWEILLDIPIWSLDRVLATF